MKKNVMCFIFRAFLVLSLLIIGGISEAEAAAETELEGKWVGKDHHEGWTMLFTGDHLSSKSPNPQVWYEAAFKCDSDAEPKTIDIHIKECGVPQYVGLASKAIYKIEEDTLTIAMNEPGKETRPEEFSMSGGAVVLILAKEK